MSIRSLTSKLVDNVRSHVIDRINTTLSRLTCTGRQNSECFVIVTVDEDQIPTYYVDTTDDGDVKYSRDPQLTQLFLSIDDASF